MNFRKAGCERRMRHGSALFPFPAWFPKVLWSIIFAKTQFIAFQSRFRLRAISQRQRVK